MTDDHNTARIAAFMDQFSASIRDDPKKIEISRTELFGLVNMALLGVDAVMASFAPQDMRPEAAVQAQANLKTLSEVLAEMTSEEPQEPDFPIVMFAAKVLGVIKARFDDVNLRAGDEEDEP